jgi:proteasome accessory factor B
MVWREGSLSGESRRALLKLRSLGVAADEPMLGYAPRVRLRDAAFEPLDAALEKRFVVRFPYLKPGEQAARQREVIPLALVQYQGRWHLSAEEYVDGGATVGARKMFLLRRIVGPVTTGKAAPQRPGDHTAEAVAGLEDVWRRGIAEVEVTPDTDAATRLSNRRDTESVDGTRLRLHFVDLAILADELAGFGPEVLVLSPPELRDAVVERLERVETEHEEAARG